MWCVTVEGKPSNLSAPDVKLTSVDSLTVSWTSPRLTNGRLLNYSIIQLRPRPPVIIANRSAVLPPPYSFTLTGPFYMKRFSSLWRSCITHSLFSIELPLKRISDMAFFSPFWIIYKLRIACCSVKWSDCRNYSQLNFFEIWWRFIHTYIHIRLLHRMTERICTRSKYK